MNLWQRLRAATGLVLKGLPSPFNKISDLGGITGESLVSPYKNSTWVQRAIKIVSLPMTDVPLRFSTDTRGGRQLINDPSLMQWWENPAIGQDKQPLALSDFIEATNGWLKLTGDAFWILDDTVFTDRSRLPFPEAGLTFPKLMIVRPDRMQPLHARATNELLGWEMTDAAGQRIKFALEQVIHLRAWNPTDPTCGQSEMDPARIAAESDYLAGRFKLNLMRNNGDRGPIIAVKNPGMLNDAQVAQLVAQFREKKELASRGIFKAAVVGGDISVSDPAVSAVDSGYVAARVEDRHEIFIAFGVPPSMAEVVASYSVGAASDWYRLIMGTCKPEGTRITNAIERVLRLQRPGAPVFAWFDWSKHPVLQQVRREAVDAGTKLWDRGMPWKNVSDWLELDLPTFPEDQTGFLPFSVAPVSQVMEPPLSGPSFNEPGSTPSPGGEGGGEGEFTEAEKALREAFGRRGVDGTTGRARKQHDQHMARRRPAIKRFEAAIARDLAPARAEVLRKIEAGYVPADEVGRGSRRADTDQGSAGASPYQTKAAAIDFLFDLSKLAASLRASLRRASAATLQEAGSQLFSEVKKDDVFTMPPAKALEFLAARQNQLSGVPDEVHDRIKAALQAGIDGGESMAKLSDRVRGEFNDIGKGRAKVIASTETAAAYGEARDEAMKQAGVQYKQWLTSGLPNVRTAHRGAQGQTVRIDEPFDVGGEELMHPGDETGSAENVINCHCVSIAVAAPEEET